jgi:hypothetical protein
LQGNLVQPLAHDSDSLCELWHGILGHLHYRDFLILRGIVIGLPEFMIDQKGVCKGCALGKNSKDTFPSSEIRSKGILDLSNVRGLILVESL